MALPVFGGMSVELITLFVVPVVFCGYEELKMLAGFDKSYPTSAEDESAVSLIPTHDRAELSPPHTRAQGIKQGTLQMDYAHEMEQKDHEESA